MPVAADEPDPPPFFAAHVFVCCNHRPEGHRRGSCATRGSERLRDYMKVRAKELGLSGYSGKKKSELISALRNH